MQPSRFRPWSSGWSADDPIGQSTPPQNLPLPLTPNLTLPSTPEDLIAESDENEYLTLVAAATVPDPFSWYSVGSSIPYWFQHGGAVSLLGPFDVAASASQYGTVVGQLNNGPYKRPAPEHSREPSPARKVVRTLEECTSSLAGPENDLTSHIKPHFELGVIHDKHYCACGNAYTQAFRLREHVASLQADDRFNCLQCKSTFRRKDSLLRHVNTKHMGGQVACPGCSKLFRPDYLSHHFTVARTEACRSAARALRLQEPAEGVDASELIGNVWHPNISQRLLETQASVFSAPVGQPLPHHGVTAHDPSSNSLSSYYTPYEATDPIPGADILSWTPQGRSNQASRVVRPQEACPVCKLPFGHTRQEIIDHILHHRRFVTETHQCEDCMIDFMYERDLRLHEKAVLEDKNCGFRFCHAVNNAVNASKDCTGHHPPSNIVNFLDNHQRMQILVWEWENRQLRYGQRVCGRLNDKFVHDSQTPRYSLEEDGLDCMFFSRLSMESVHSFQSVPAWLHYHEESTDPTRSATNTTDGSIPRPEFVLLPGHSALTSSCPADGNHKNSYAELLENLRTHDGLKKRASGVRYHTKAAERFLHPPYASSDSPLGLTQIKARGIRYHTRAAARYLSPRSASPEIEPKCEE